MELNISKQVENPLLDRTEIYFDCLYQGEPTPKVLDIKNRLVAMLNVDKNLLVVYRLKPSFGEGKADGYAKLYGSQESLKEIELENVLQKNSEPKKEETEEAE